MKTIGIIGGFGPEATAQFYLELVSKIRSKTGHQPHIILRNVSVPKKLEDDALIHGKNINAFAPFLISAAKELRHAGADCIVLPCNTLHVLEPHIKKAISIPFISIIDAAIEELQKRGVQKVGLLGTSVTVRNNLFAKKDTTIQFVVPPHHIQKKLDNGIHTFVTTMDAKHLEIALRDAVRSFQSEKIGDVLVACTDFHGLCPHIKGIVLHDTLDILVQKTIESKG